MERIIWPHQSLQPFYVFDEKHIVHFWDDGVSIHHAGKCYRDANTRLSPFDGPHVYPKALGLEFYKNAVLKQRLPIAISLAGENLGVVKCSSDYVFGAREAGSYMRRIVKQETKLSIKGDRLLFRIKIDAGSVDPQTAQARLGNEDKRPKSFRFEFPFPLDLVPELFNLTESERRAFERLRVSATAERQPPRRRVDSRQVSLRTR